MDRKLIALAIIIGVGVGNACAQRPPHLRRLLLGKKQCHWVAPKAKRQRLVCTISPGIQLQVDSAGVGQASDSAGIGMGGTSAAQPSDSSGIGMGGTTSCLWIPIVTATGTEWSLYCGFYLKLSVDTSGVGSGGT